MKSCFQLFTVTFLTCLLLGCDSQGVPEPPPRVSEPPPPPPPQLPIHVQMSWGRFLGNQISFHVSHSSEGYIHNATIQITILDGKGLTEEDRETWRTYWGKETIKDWRPGEGGKVALRGGATNVTHPVRIRLTVKADEGEYDGTARFVPD